MRRPDTSEQAPDTREEEEDRLDEHALRRRMR